MRGKRAKKERRARATRVPAEPRKGSALINVTISIGRSGETRIVEAGEIQRPGRRL